VTTLRIPTWLRRLFATGKPGDAHAAGGRDIASNIVLQLVARVLMMLIGIVTVSLMARTLDPSGFGVYNAMASYVGLFTVLTDLGITTVSLQRMTADPARESEWLGALVGLRVALSLVVMAACAISIPLFLSNAHHGHLVGLIATAGILSAGPNTLMTVFQARMRVGLALSLSLLSSVLWLGETIALAIAHGSVVAFAIANFAQLLLISLIQVRVTLRYVHIAWRVGRKHWRSLAKVALPLGIASVLITVYYQIDSVLLLQIAGPRETGLYSAAYRFLAPLLFFPTAVMSAFFPVLSAVHQEDPARVRRLVQTCAEMMAVIGVPVLAGSLALSGELVSLLYGNGYAQAAALLPILMIAFLSICFGSLAGYMAPILQLQWRLAVYSAAGAIANVVLNLVLIPRYGAFGSAWATVATEVLTMVLMLGTCLRTLRLTIAPGRLIRTALVGAVMTGVMFLARPLGLFAAGSLGGLVYGGGLLTLRVFSWTELRALRAGTS
jgi:O-antigen/teichoic acid export membrane protein